jgi:subtilisin family serine protease
MRGLGSLRGSIAAVLAVAFIATSFDTAWTAREPLNSRVDPSLSAGEVALVHTTGGHAGALSFSLAQLGATEIETDDAIDMVVARLSPAALDAIKHDATVTLATRDIPIVALDKGKGDTGFEKADAESNKNNNDKNAGERDNERTTTASGASVSVMAIRGPQAWTMSTGEGVTVAIMDTGIDEHADLRGRVRNRVDFVKDGSAKKDAGGHGTFIAGIIAANGDLKGVAPDARIVSLRVLDANGNGTLKGVIAAFQWVFKNQARNKVDVLNLSWGAPQATTYHKDLLSALVEAVWFSGVTVVAAVGNDGPGAVTSPAADPFIVTVGSFGDHGTAAAGDDTLSSFSASGPTLDGFAKPDILAPGEHVKSLRVRGVTYIGADGNPVGSATDQYIHMTGTSASAAFVTGVAALVASDHKRYKPTQIKGAIVASTRRIAGSLAGAIDAPNALERTPAAVNVGLRPSKLLLALLARSGQLRVKGVTWEGVTWDGVTWDGVTWDGVTWDGVTWESVSWESVSWESVSWETVTWEGVTWAQSVIAE